MEALLMGLTPLFSHLRVRRSPCRHISHPTLVQRSPFSRGYAQCEDLHGKNMAEFTGLWLPSTMMLSRAKAI